MTYTHEGKQYIAVLTGVGGWGRIGPDYFALRPYQPGRNRVADG